MSPEAARIVFAFEAMPKTQEKTEIAQQYLSNEIGLFDFLRLAEDYMNKEKEIEG